MNEKYDHCLRCGRKIKSAKAQKLGYGPVCYRKEQAESTAKETEQEVEIQCPNANMPS